MALERPVTVNTISAGEKLFVDLLPDSWNGLPPGLPQDVVDDLARRARAADLVLQRQRQATQQKKIAAVRVRVATQPTFTRYLFDIPDQTAVSVDRGKDRLVLNFDAPITFDLADAQAALPGPVAAISSELESDSALVRFMFIAKVDVRTFRDEKGYVVDVDNAAGNPDQPSQAPQGLLEGTDPAPKAVSEGAPVPDAAAKVEVPNVEAPAPSVAAAPATAPPQTVPAAPPAAALASPAAQPSAPADSNTETRGAKSRAAACCAVQRQTRFGAGSAEQPRAAAK